jgi:hypothetical protein
MPLSHRTFRAPLGRRVVFYPLAVLVYALGIRAWFEDILAGKGCLLAGIFVAGFVFTLLKLIADSIRTWSQRVVLSPEGIGVKADGAERVIPWSHVKGWSGELREGKVEARLAHSENGDSVLLPFLTARLYRALRERVGPLSPEIEHELVDAGWFRGREPRDGSGV